MECPSCHLVIPDGSKFCAECGAALSARCPSCGAAIRANAKFCAECGQKLSPGSSEAIKSAPVPPPLPLSRAEGTAERRQLTVVFCDLVGSTALSAQLDPEDMREIIGAYHRCCAEEITKAGGFVAKYMGDGVLAYFGYPQAHEDDAERSVRSALALIEAVPKLRTAHDAQVRIGIATGLVVVGDLIGEGDAQERGVVGDTPNLAARLQALAGPGQVVISQATRRLTGGQFEYHDLGRVALKGLAHPVQAWQVTGTSAVQSRFEAQHETILTPLVGREEEMELLARRWRQAASGEGRVVLLSGEPGIGKSRLTVALQERLQAEPHTRLRYFCSPQHTDSAFYPMISQLERAVRFERQDGPGVKYTKLAAVIGRTPGNDGQLELLAELLSIPSGGDLYRPVNMSPQRKKEQTIEALLRQLEVLARNHPVLMVFEDAHWIDPSSREILDLTVERAASLPILLVITFRSEFQPPWIGQPHVTVLSLSRLGRREGAALVESVVGSTFLPPEIMAEIVERTDGVPLFVEELTKAVVEAEAQVGSGNAALAGTPISGLAVPASLHTSLMARLDRLGAAAKETAQIGAAIGREFSYQLLALVAQKSEPELQFALARLVEAGLVFCRGTAPQAIYLFKHALVRDAAYGSLLRSQRQILHGRIVSIMESEFPEVGAAQPELIAQHCAEAGLVDIAIEWWSKAGEQALRRGAYVEATAHYEKAIRMADERPGGAPEGVIRLRLQIAYGQAMIAARGHGAPETTAAFLRARELSAQIEEPAERFSAYYGLWVGGYVRGELVSMKEIAATILRETKNRSGSAEACVAHRVSGVTRWFQGDYQNARIHLERASEWYDSERDRALAFQFGQDIGVSAMIYLAIALWPLGELDRARRVADEAMTHAMSSGHVATLAYGYGHLCTFGLIRRDAVGTLSHASALLELSREHTLPMWSAFGVFFHGYARALSGDDADTGLTEMRQGILLCREQGILVWAPSLLAMNALEEMEAGQLDAGSAMLDEAFAVAERTGQHWFDAELYRIRGELVLGRSHHDGEGAETAFTQAMSCAQRQQTRTFELRAATSLARLWRDQGKRTEARNLLAPIYGWFTEGFDTLDLKEAKALLEELR